LFFSGRSFVSALSNQTTMGRIGNNCQKEEEKAQIWHLFGGTMVYGAMGELAIGAIKK